MGSDRFRPEDLLRQEAWLRPLVSRLVGGDRARTDDVLQDTWIAAWSRPPQNDAARRGWLATVAANFARLARRAEVRRARHERVAALGTAGSGGSGGSDYEPAANGEDTAQVLERLEAQRQVTAAIAELDEPYRTAVLLRYFHDLSARDIAQRQGTSEATARQRVKRGLDKLRGRLEAVYGAGWRSVPGLVALMHPSLPPPAPPTTAPPSAADPTPTVQSLPQLLTIGGLVMSKSVRVGLVCVVLAVGAALTVFSGGGERAPVEPRAGARLATEVGVEDAASGEPADAEPAREAATADATADAAPIATPTPSWRGRVLDLAGRPVADAKVVRRVPIVSAPEPRIEGETRTDATGVFQLECEPFDGTVTVDDTRWSALRVADMTRDADPAAELLVVVAPRRAANGWVESESGERLAGVAVHVEPRPLVEFPAVLDRTTRVEPGTEHTDADGVFAFDALPGAGSIRLVFRKNGYRSASVDVGDEDVLDRRVVLTDYPEGVTTLAGRVLDPVGRPVVDARVGFASREARSDAFGEYRLELPAGAQWWKNSALWSAKSGFATAVVDDFGAELVDRRGESIRRDVQFPDRARSIAGRVVDAAGDGVPGVLVYPWQSPSLTDMSSAEDLAVADDVDETVQLGGPELHCYARTDADGAFTLRGLADRDYRLHVLDKTRYFGWTSGPVAAGSAAAVLQLPHDLIVPELVGKVVTMDGEPVVGARLHLSVVVHSTGYGTNWQSRSAGRTDHRGRFELSDVARPGATLGVSADGIVNDSVDVPAPNGGELTITVARRCHFRVQLTGDLASQARQIRILDDRGELAWIHRIQARVSSSFQQLQIEDGRSPALATSERATTLLVLGDKRAELARIPVRLVPGEVVVLAN